MEKIKEREAVEILLKELQRFLRAGGKAREQIAAEIDDLVSYDLMENNKEYEHFSEALKDMIDHLLFMHKWQGRGVYYGKELFFGIKDVNAIVARLKGMKRGS